MASVLAFAAICGLAGEIVEVGRLVTGGMQPPNLALRVTLFASYAAVAGLLHLAARTFRPTRSRATVVAAVLFAFFVFLPWLNLDYLPTLKSAKTIAFTLGAALLLALVVPPLARLRRAVPAAIVLLALAVNLSTLAGSRQAAVEAPRQAAADGARNVLLILIDTLRADHLGAYGYARGTSPTFDRLARQSIVFERNVAQASWTKPSVASIFTGAYVHEHGVTSSRDALATKLPTISEVLRDRGYHTVAFSANPWITPEFHFDRGFERFEAGRPMSAQLTNLFRVGMRFERALRRVGVTLPLNDWVFFAAAEPSLSNARRDELLTDAALEWLGHDVPEPFFAYVHLIGPHDAYDPPARYADLFREEGRADDMPRLKRPPARVQSIFETAAPLDELSMAGLVAQYDGAILYTDELLHRLLEGLDKAKLDDRTLVIVTADHGEEFYEHGNWRHGNQLYDEVVHVPLVMRLPGVLKPERRPDASMNIDIFPTVLGLLGQSEAPHRMSGRNLFASPQVPFPAVYSEHWRFEGGEYSSHMVSWDRWKMNETRDSSGKSRIELYDLDTDPREKQNLFGKIDGAQENELHELQTLLANFSRNEPARAAAGAEVDVDRSTKERLRQLGY
jgi:arylsulfatase A-like enzyme